MTVAYAAKTVDDVRWNQIVDDLTRRQFGAGLGVAALAALAAACSGSDAATGDTSGTRAVEHARGVTDVPFRAERVVVLDSLPIDTVVSLGVTPVGAAEAGSASSLPEYLGSGLDGTESVGKIAEPNLESIARLQPDLILSNDQRHGEIYESLSNIAPTVFAASPAVDWQGSIHLYADALGRTETADEALTRYHERTAALTERFAATPRTAHILRVVDPGVRLHGPRTFGGSVLTEAGLLVTGHEWDAKNDMAELSLEHVGLVDSDLLFIANNLPEGDLGLPPELVSQFGAAESGGIRQVDYRIWITGIGLAGANRILDDLETALA